MTSEYLDKTTGPACFSLWYFMHGSQVGNLSVYINESLTGSRRVCGFQGERGFQWNQLECDISSQSSSNEFQIYIEGVVSCFF